MVIQHPRINPNGLTFPSLLWSRLPTVEKFVQVSWYPYGISQRKMMMCTKLLSLFQMNSTAQLVQYFILSLWHLNNWRTLKVQLFWSPRLIGTFFPQLQLATWACAVNHFLVAAISFLPNGIAENVAETGKLKDTAHVRVAEKKYFQMKIAVITWSHSKKEFWTVWMPWKLNVCLLLWFGITLSKFLYEINKDVEFEIWIWMPVLQCLLIGTFYNLELQIATWAYTINNFLFASTRLFPDCVAENVDAAR